MATRNLFIITNLANNHTEVSANCLLVKDEQSSDNGRIQELKINLEPPVDPLSPAWFSASIEMNSFITTLPRLDPSGGFKVGLMGIVTPGWQILRNFFFEIYLKPQGKKLAKT